MTAQRENELLLLSVFSAAVVQYPAKTKYFKGFLLG